MKRFAVPLVSGLLAGCMLCFPGEAAQAAADAIRLWALAILPSLFPFLACMLFVSAGLTRKKRSGANRFLGLPKGMAAFWLMGLMSGSPGGARLVQELSLRDEAGRQATQRFALYSGTMSPMFFAATLGGWLHSTRLGWLMLLCHWLAAFLTGQLSRFFFPAPELPANEPAAAKKPLTLSQVMQSAAMAMLTVCGLMILGSVAAKMAQCALPGLPEGMLAGLQAFMEVTAGCSRILQLPLPSAYPALRPALLCAAASFSGLSILLQNLAFLQESGVTLRFLLAGGLCRALISFGLVQLMYPLAGAPAVLTSVPAVQAASAAPIIVVAAWFLSLLLPGIPRKKKLFS